MTGFASLATSGFPACAASPAVAPSGDCTSTAAAHEYQVVTLWDSLADLELFRASDAMRELTAAASGLTVRPSGEALFDLIEDA